MEAQSSATYKNIYNLLPKQHTKMLLEYLFHSGLPKSLVMYTPDAKV